ncbi:hypothetical protein ABZ570_23485 [Micromonospora sp. NPDC007271]|uniref:hypothetical protein n=1 Tax=Micromonospora sp. NPDC007271 TaxID=3154587 RepID=UPI0034017729
MTVSARERVAAFWDDHIEEWLSGADPTPPPLLQWFKSYQGVGPGQPTRDGFPEPYHGDLVGRERTPRMVVLGLNPGEFHSEFQSRDGICANEIKQHGSYSKWQTTCPYKRAPWTNAMGGNRYYRARLQFTRNWLQDPTADRRDLLIFESYPWHSKSITHLCGPRRRPSTSSCGSRSRNCPSKRCLPSAVPGTTSLRCSVYRFSTSWAPADPATVRRCQAGLCGRTGCRRASG